MWMDPILSVCLLPAQTAVRLSGGKSEREVECRLHAKTDCNYMLYVVTPSERSLPVALPPSLSGIFPEKRGV